MKKIIYTICKTGLLFILFSTVSCYKDKGNYDLHEINKIAILKNGADSFQINQFEKLTITPNVKQSMATTEDNLEYRWSAYLAKEPMVGIVHEELAKTRDLDIQFGLAPADYTILYSVTDKNTGVSEFKKYFLQVGNKLSEGWLMVSESKQGSTDVDLLHPDGYAIEKLLSSANPSYIIPKGLHSIRVLTTFFGGSQDIYILGENDALRVQYTDFKKRSELKDWFVEEPLEVCRPQDRAYDVVGSNEFYMDNGKIFSNQIGVRFGVPMAGDYELAPFIYPDQSRDIATVYDQKNKRFYNYSGKVFKEFGSTGAFDMSNVGLTAVFGGVAPDNQFSYVMKNDSEDFYVLRISHGGAIGKYRINAAENITKIEHAAFSGLYFHIYYSVGNKVYLLDVPNNRSRLVYTFEGNEKVTALTLKQSRSNFVGYADNNRTLAVGTYNGEEGKVYTFSINNVGEFADDTYVKQYTGLEKPISLTYKNRK